MRQGGSEACARRRLRKRTIPSNPLGFEEKSLTAPERGVKSGLPTVWRKSMRQPGAFDAKIFRRWRKEERFSSGATLRRSVAKFFRKCSGVLRALSARERSGLNAARLRIGVSGIVSLLKGEAAGLAAVGARSPGFERLARAAGSVGQPLSARLAGELCAGASEASQRCPPCCVLQAKSSADFGGVGGETPERTGEGECTAEERAHGGRPACAAPQHQRILREECFVKTSQRSLTAMPSSRSSSTSFCASAGTASRHTGESPSSMVL